MSEVKLQSDIAVEFSRRYPKMKGQLFHVSNERNNKIQAFQARAIGIIPGVSDFIFIKGFHPRENGTKATFIIAMEVKEPGSYHNIDHIRQQVEWGKVLERCGGRWFIVRSVDEAIQAIEGNYEDGLLTLQDVESMVNSCNKKNLKF